MEKNNRNSGGLLRALSILLTACLLTCAVLITPLAAPKSAEAATVRLPKTEGAVDVTDGAGIQVSMVENMRLFSGSHTKTGERSYAWFSLDDTKVLKEDAVSEVEIRKRGEKLEVLLDFGKLYFNVTAPLRDEESLNIRTSTMVLGLRGTSGWVQVIDGRITRVWLLTGEAECIVTNPVNGQTKRIRLRAGDTADFYVYDPARPVDQTDIIFRRFGREDIPGYVLKELVGDTDHILKIYEESGIDLRDLTVDEAEARLSADEDRMAQELARVREEEALLDSRRSKDPVWDRDEEAERQTAGGAGSGSSDDSDGDDATSRIVRLTMPVTAAVVQGYLNDAGVDQVILQPGPTPALNTLQVDINFTVPAGKTLTALSGVPVDVNAGTQTDVNGTANLQDALNNNGDIYVNSSDTLKVSGLITNRGSFVNQASGRTVASGGFLNTGGGALTNRGTLSIAGGLTGSDYFKSESGTFNGDVTVTDGWFSVGGGRVNGTVTVSGDSYVSVSGGEISGSGAGGSLILSLDDYSTAYFEGGTVTNTGSGPALSWTTGGGGGTPDPGGTLFRARASAPVDPLPAGWAAVTEGSYQVLKKTGLLGATASDADEDF